MVISIVNVAFLYCSAFLFKTVQKQDSAKSLSCSRPCLEDFVLMSLNIFCASILGIDCYELSPSQMHGNRPCYSRNFKAYQYMKVTNSFKSTVTSKSYLVHTFANCKTKGVIYLTECRSCGMQYMGETKKALHKHLNSLRFDIRCKRTQKPVSEHFNLPGHSMKDLTIMKITNDDQTRRSCMTEVLD